MRDDASRLDSPQTATAENASQNTSLDGESLSVCYRFEKQAMLFPEKTAVNLGGSALTYRELNDLAEALACHLRQRGVGPGTLVGVLLERSLELAVSLVAVLKAGAAYVPLDCHYPAERLLWMAADSGIKTVLTSGDLAAQVPRELGDILLVDMVHLARRGATPESAAAAHSNGDGEQPAYIMFTSGSTGMPKGVAIPHRGIVRLVCNADFVDLGPEDVFLHLSPISFDASTFEIWGALLNGARVALLPAGPLSLAAIGETIRREKVSVLWLTAGLFNLMVDERLGDLRPVRQLLVGGEALSAPHVERALAGLPHTQLINGYGPTENTTFTCCYRIPREADLSRGVPIGRAIRGTYVHIVDEALRPLPVGEVGELVSGGLGLALGYWRRPDLTRERFVDDPASAGAGGKVYRTGDLARRRPDGIFEFLGRRDTQVKIRGFRIELGEIEAALRKHPGVRDCAVGVLEGEGAGKSLAGYVVRRAAGEPSAGDLRQFLSACLPAHLVPSAWEFLAALPLNPNGKVDRGALAGVKAKPASQACEPPHTGLESVIASVWQEIMGERKFSVADNFFDVGGDSLMVTQLHDRLCKRAGLALQLTDLFRFPTVRSLAQYAGGQGQAHAVASNAHEVERGRRQRSVLDKFRKA